MKTQDILLELSRVVDQKAARSISFPQSSHIDGNEPCQFLCGHSSNGDQVTFVKTPHREEVWITWALEAKNNSETRCIEVTDKFNQDSSSRIKYHQLTHATKIINLTARIHTGSSEQWLNQPNKMLDNRTPLDMIDNEENLIKTEEILEKSVKIIDYAIEVFNDESAAKEWLNTLNPDLGDVTPIDALGSSEGIEKVRGMLDGVRSKKIRAEAHDRGVELKKKLIHLEGEPLTAAEVMNRLGIPPSQLQEIQAQGQILGVYWNDEFLYPSWQFNESGDILPGLQSVINALDTYSSWEKLSFLLSKNARLKDRKTPLQGLRDGNIESVVSAATA